MKECYPIKGCMAFLIIAFFVSEKLKIKNLDLIWVFMIKPDLGEKLVLEFTWFYWEKSANGKF